MSHRATTIAVVNQKGGTAKTTTTENLGIGLAQEGKKVLLIDTDPQASLTISLGYPRRRSSIVAIFDHTNCHRGLWATRQIDSMASMIITEAAEKRMTRVDSTKTCGVTTMIAEALSGGQKEIGRWLTHFTIKRAQENAQHQDVKRF